jgi:general secretion pathway protein D
VLVFADAPVEAEQLPVNAGSAVLVFPGSRLDPSAPKRIRGEAGSRIRLVNLFERQNVDPPEVRLVVQLTSGPPPTLSQRGSVVALSVPPVPGARRPAARDSGGRSARPAAAAAAVPEPTFPARMLGVEVTEAVKRLSRFIEEPLLLPDDVQGRVSIDAPEPITKTEARAMLEAILLLKGFAAVPTPGGVRKVVPITGDIGPWVSELSKGEGQMLLTTLIKLEAIDAGLVLQAIKPLIGAQGLAIPFTPTNAIILGGAAPRLERLVNVIRELDRTGPRKIVMLRLEHADATETAASLEEVFRDDVTGVEVWPDARTNRLVVRGRPDKIEQIRSFVRRVDRERGDGGAIQVVPVQFADVDRIAEMLRAMQSGGEGRARGASSLAGRDFALSVHDPSHSLVVQADPTTLELIRSVLEEVDVPPARIDVEVTVAQVALDEGFSFGLSLLAPLVDAEEPDDFIAFIVSDSGGTLLPTLAQELAVPGSTSPLDFIPDGTLQSVITYDPLTVPIVGPGGVPISLAAAVGIDASETDFDTRILLRPRLSLLNGEEHELFAGDDIPIPVSSTAEGGGTFEVRQNVERQNVGVSLRLRPTLTAADIVDLDLDLEVSNVAFTTLSAAAVSDTGVAIQERTLATRARLRPGQVAVVGWLSGPQTSKRQVGTPFLQSIPILGWFFKRVEERTRSVTLLVTARAAVFRPEASALTQWMLRSIARQAVATPPGDGAAEPAEVSLQP